MRTVLMSASLCAPRAMKRVFVFSSPTFQGFRVPVDVVAAGSVDGIVAECVQTLCATFRALGTEHLAARAARGTFHVHGTSGRGAVPDATALYSEICNSEPHAAFFVCEHIDRPNIAESAVAEITVRPTTAPTEEIVYVCLLPARDAFTCANQLHGTESPGGTVVDVRFFFLTAAKPRVFDPQSVEGLSRLRPPAFVATFLKNQNGL